MRNSGEWGNSSMAGMGSGRRRACRRFWASPRGGGRIFSIRGRRVGVSAVFAPLADWLPRSCVAVVDGCLLPYARLSARGPSQPRGTPAGSVKKSLGVRKELMSEPFRPYERLVEITIFGKKFQVPEKNSVLRCFQYISPETVPYGRFCWNQDCQYCRIMCQLPDDDQPREMLSCKFIVMPGMAITDISQELKWCLRAKLPAASAVSR